MTTAIRWGSGVEIIGWVGGWTKTRPVSLGLLPSGPDPVGERYVLRQPPAPQMDHRASGRKGERGEPTAGAKSEISNGMRQGVDSPSSRPAAQNVEVGLRTFR